MIALVPCPVCHGASLSIVTQPGESAAMVQCVCGTRGPLRSSQHIPPGVAFDTVARHEWNVWAKARRELDN